MSVCMSAREHVCIYVHLHSTCIHMCTCTDMGTDNFLENVIITLQHSTKRIENSIARIL